MTDEKEETFVAIGPLAFGFGDSPEEALGNCSVNISMSRLKGNEAHANVSKVHPDTEVSTFDGSLHYPKEHPPEEVMEKELVIETKSLEDLEVGEYIRDMGILFEVVGIEGNKVVGRDVEPICEEDDEFSDLYATEYDVYHYHPDMPQD